MKGIPPETCTHHIYIHNGARPVQQPQRRMNLALRDVVKEDLQELSEVDFIYPILESQWVSPLVFVPKKDWRWHICIDYRELNKATLKDYFPLPFIDQVLDTVVGKKYFSFLDGFSGVHFLTDFFHLGYVIPWLPFKGTSWPFLLTLSVWKYIWMTFLCLVIHFRKPSRI